MSNQSDCLTNPVCPYPTSGNIIRAVKYISHIPFRQKLFIMKTKLAKDRYLAR